MQFSLKYLDFWDAKGSAIFFSRFLLHFCESSHKFKFSGEICSALRGCKIVKNG